MTTQRKAASNRKNAVKSTGPRTPSGRSVSATNAIKHGVFASVPVLHGVENENDWVTHRAGVLESLAPVGLLETRLGERVASLLWRLDRVTRYETACVAASLDEADDPQTQATENPFDSLLGIKVVKPRLEEARLELARDTGLLEATEDGLAVLARLADAPDDTPVTWDQAFTILESAHSKLPEDSDAAWVEDREFTEALGQDDDPHELDWTVGLIRRGLDYLTHAGGMPLAKLTAKIERSLREHVTQHRGIVQRLTAEVASLEEQSAKVSRRRKAHLLLPEQNAELKVLRYENHLSRQLFQTLHELQRLQAARAGDRVMPPVAVEVGLNLAAAASEA